MKSKGSILVSLATALTVLAACITQQRARFSHTTHVAEQRCGGPGEPTCLSCATCHTNPARAGDVALPEVAVCARCHDEEAALQKVALPAEARASFSRTVHFSHERHLAMPEVRGQCVPCHAGVAHGTGTVGAFPPMQKCFDCHEHEQQWQAGECAPCHDRDDMQGVLPQTFLRHGPGFATGHAALARKDEHVCAQCHTRNDCDDCHDIGQGLRVERRQPDALERSFVHRGDYLSRHSIEARADQASCMRCHSRSSCDDCHLEHGVSDNRFAAANPHPPGWVGSFTGASSFHGAAARRDIVSCAGCHDQGPATNCIGCHRVGAYGGNPHPSGWQSSRTPNDQMCRYCHGS